MNEIRKNEHKREEKKPNSVSIKNINSHNVERSLFIKSSTAHSSHSFSHSGSAEYKNHMFPISSTATTTQTCDQINAEKKRVSTAVDATFKEI